MQHRAHAQSLTCKDVNLETKYAPGETIRTTLPCSFGSESTKATAHAKMLMFVCWSTATRIFYKNWCKWGTIFFTEWSLRNIWKTRQRKLMQRHISDGQKWKLAGKGVKCANGPWAAQWQGHASLHQIFGYAWALTIRRHWMIKWAYKPIHVGYPTWVPTAKQFVFKFICAWKLA